jgi:membrane peptidoglycan carboxypeptidase
MPSTLTAAASKTASTQAVQPGPTRRPYRHPLWLGLLLGSLTCSGLLYAYLQCGWFESAHLGQVLQIRRMHAEGPRYRAQRPWGVFPRAHRLLHDTFTDNAWTIVSTDGEVLYEHLPSWWTVPLSQLPQQVRMAFVLREDQRFYQHAGVDVRALLRAIVKTLTGRKQGGSTIAVQVAKHCLLNYGERPTRAWITGGIRKIREMLLAWRLVKVEGRDNVLEYYLNHAPMGPGLYGIGPAAWDYFGKKPRELSVGEAALLAILLPSPGRSPRHAAYYARYETARQALLQRLYEAQVINAVTYQQALHPPMLYASVQHHVSMAAPQTVAGAFRAVDLILARFGLRSTPQQLLYERPFPIRIRVSLHSRLSQWFDEATAPALQDEELRYAGLMLVDGRPVVLVGGELELFHYVFQARRQVGSVSKLFFYETVWRLGYVHPDTIVADGDMPEPRRQRLARPLYHPRNDDGRLRAPLPHYQALSHSLNTIAYRTTWGERTDAQRYAIARMLVERFGFPWQQRTPDPLPHFYSVFTTDETAPLGTWQATPFEVAGSVSITGESCTGRLP